MEPFGTSNWLAIILLGLVAGVLARLVTPGRRRLGIILTALLGIGGALLASWIGQQLGWYASGQPAGFLGALLGAILILGIAQLFRGR
ncbi:GlsB/YeaQ/YmgE family stress response membrane protein [Luteimonas sp. SJ-92]|uniref:GlsB/YeaQ/YmgE family stress response membrane protein n=1 Tax=Luteimonas salinisoli TaxID=2752307 RepID=A0A853JGC1_9GAMM|nr:GlsB/YeaQ/YmgE family stress response membrane protein [Luteimonas salinisoli]NZA27498.1 GlsB/YeaQ/YmgE family stress response membrane protein [Luteimonas salinisoli]